MVDHIVLDIAIGIIFVFLVYSLLASAINEIIAAMLAQRGRMLARGIQRMLNGESIYWWHNLENIFRKNTSPSPRHRRYKGSLAELVREHTVFKRLAKHNKPSYLSDKKFADILLDILHQKSKAPGQPGKDKALSFEAVSFDSVKSGIVEVLNELDQKSLKNDCGDADKNCYANRRQELYEVFNVLLDQANGDLQKLRKLIEDWYNEMMDRVSGWYKKQTHQVLFFIGLGLAILFRVDSIEIVRNLSKDTDARQTLVAMADSYIKNHPRPDSVYKRDSNNVLIRDSTRMDSTNYKLADSVIRLAYNDARKRVDSVNAVLGSQWGDYAFFGVLITALAICLGAPFWFDLLNKLVNLRMNGRKPEDPKSNVAAQQPVTIKIENKSEEEAIG